MPARRWRCGPAQVLAVHRCTRQQPRGQRMRQRTLHGPALFTLGRARRLRRCRGRRDATDHVGGEPARFTIQRVGVQISQLALKRFGARC
jgi:hypothetical protein